MKRLRPRAFFVALVVFALAPVVVDAQTPTASQVRIPASALREQAEIERLMVEGRELEEQGRWADAMTLYEDGVRRYADTNLQQRLDIARLHYDLSRRYADSSFRDTIRTANEHTSLSAYGEVLLKIDAYHVDRPHWNGLVRRGADALQVAIDDAAFREVNLPANSVVTGRQVAAEMFDVLDGYAIDGRYDAQHAVGTVARRLSQRWGLRPSATIYEFTCGAIGSLDPYSAYLTADQYNEVISQIDGNFVGLGIELQPQPEHLEVVSVIAGGPAGRAGLQPGDRIVEVDQQAVLAIGGDRAADLLRGPEGSAITLLVVDPQGHRRRFDCTRERVEIPSVEDARILDTQAGIAYLKLTTFQRTTADEMRTALWNLHRRGMRSLIIDVRGNPGGLLDASVDLANLFLTDGTIVSTKGRNPNEDRVRQARNDGTWGVPLTVLIDGNAASASEIFAGAIRDHRRGQLIGERTYGKGSVQGIFPLNTAGGGIRLTTAKFYSPSGQAISHNGVSPDLQVETTFKVSASGDPADTGDPVLNAALRTAGERLTAALSSQR